VRSHVIAGYPRLRPPVVVGRGQVSKLRSCGPKVVDKTLPAAARRRYILSCPEGPARSTPSQRFWRKRCQRSVRKLLDPQRFSSRTQDVHRGNRNVEGLVAGPAVAGARSTADREVFGLLDRSGRSGRYTRTRSPIERFLWALLCARNRPRPLRMGRIGRKFQDFTLLPDRCGSTVRSLLRGFPDGTDRFRLSSTARIAGRTSWKRGTRAR
jgi:hypothetical protein